MISDSIPDILEDLKRTRKAVVALGCSFVQGAELDITCPIEENKRFYKNSLTFVNQLCEIYLEKKYTPINFGQEAAGNFAAISRLFLYEIPWSSLEEIIVIFMPTGMQRFDIIKDDNTSRVGWDFKTLWPFIRNKALTNFEILSHYYEKTIHSDKFEVLNFVLNMQFLNSWVNQHKAKLIVFPAFSNDFNKEYFSKNLNKNIYRTDDYRLTTESNSTVPAYNVDFLLNQVPWDKFIEINGSKNFFDFCYKNDPLYDPTLSMYSVLSKNLLTDNKWILPKGHPSKQGHNLLARKLFEIITAV